MKAYTLGFIGGGNMARSLIGGLVPETIDASRILVGEPDAERRQQLVQEFGIRGHEDNDPVIAAADAVVVAVKPQVIGDVLEPLAPAFSTSRPLIISIVAGIRVETINRLLGGTHAVVRVMPNTPALVGRGAAGLYAGPGVTDGQRDIATTLLAATGIAEWVESESDIDTVTALSGSGPAYFMFFIQALAEAAVRAGLDPEAATRLAIETAAGAAELAGQSDEDLETLIRRVTSPGGTTEQALHSFRENALADIVGAAVDAARNRSIELATELDPANKPT